MYMLFVVLIAGGPLLAVCFAVSLVGLRLPEIHIPPAIHPVTKEELKAMQITAREVARRHRTQFRPSPGNKPVPALSGDTWRQVLGLPLGEHRRSVAHKAYRALARANHPDRYGSNETMQLVNVAWKQAKKELVLS